LDTKKKETLIGADYADKNKKKSAYFSVDQRLKKKLLIAGKSRHRLA
jgi:hypothetical protein